MKRILLQAFFVCAFALLLSISVNAQDKVKKNVALKTLNISKKVTYVVVGNSAKYTWKAAKFTGKHVAKPIIVKSAPKVGKFMLKQSGTAIKKSFPVGKKLFIKYIKYKFLP